MIVPWHTTDQPVAFYGCFRGEWNLLSYYMFEWFV